MPFECVLLPEAEEEYIESYRWYEEQQTGLGEKFAEVFRNKISRISSNPFAYKIIRHPFRETILGKPFPYVVVFFIDDEEYRVIITSVFYTHRHPKKKFKKKL